MKNFLIFSSVIILVAVFVVSLNKRDETQKKINSNRPDETADQIMESLLKNSSASAPQNNNDNNTNTNSPANLNLEQNNMNTKTIDPPKELTIDPEKNNIVVLKTTAGDIHIALTTKMTPMTANNFAYLAKNNFYDGTIFHRTIKGFMIQGGDPNGDGTGGPGYRFGDEPFEGEYTRGIVAMANSGPDTNGSQFFIMHNDYALPANYVIFGKVIEGMETVDKIAEAPTLTEGEGSTPVSPVTIIKAELIVE